MASIAKTLAVLVLGLGLGASATGSRGGSLDFFSDDKCQDLIKAETAPIPLDVCMVASPLGRLTRSFRVDQKPYCPDGSRPSLLFYQDCACTDGVANWIPNANYGDYGNGSCQAGWGGDFLMFVLSCGEFKEPVRSVISFAATFPSPSTSTKPVGCPPLTGDASATTASGSAASDTAASATFGSAEATSTTDSNSDSSSSSRQDGDDSSSSSYSIPSTATGTRTKGASATGTHSQAAATTTSAAIGRYHEMGALYFMGYAGIFGLVSYFTL
ncbi:uncharacterized protein TRIREDRAFT_105984 [Trichoderma reesei QM6a]|jgi:hypothetical protein|uniref:Predicted protein n=2 Tax=Hypocrea jecorina TaxID=51453 RepID=G0RFW4_HYPJQ|nr:uncharacterized protein TRIREDRAFT_105984 [Trichoderma reesei QM6a]EGR49777.1 predicted protein [Trichoderma reesei QM6a]ETS03362.1 hypothetical protein M419DRAFT_128655 [Trichoderma reesei RUT C-30]